LKQRRYKVRRGDTLSSIAHKLPCASVQDVAEMNGLRHNSLSIGQTLKIPVCR
jgi:membrane-bound lytic murein transglycosylase D